jgi:O-antigen/teichoic acid export membrane protein
VSFVLISCGIVACSGLFFITKGWLFESVEFSLVVATLLLVAASTISLLFRYVIIASLRTKKLLVISIISSVLKLVLTVVLVLVGAGVLGVTIGFAVAPILSSLWLAFYIMSILKSSDNKLPIAKYGHSLRALFAASMVNWIPLLIDTIGSQLGTLVVLGSHGAIQAGYYFIAFQISNGISAIIWALESATFPALSTMDKGRNLFLWRVVKIGLIILSPVSFAVFFYARDIMGLFGNSYVQGFYALQILLLSVLPTTLMAGLGILLYSYGNYKGVLAIGLATSIPRVLLYFIFVPWHSGGGAALSYTIGSLTGFVVSVIISRTMGIVILWRSVALIAIIPACVAFLSSLFIIHFVAGLVVSIFVSYLLLLKLRLIDRSDIEGSLEALPSNIAKPLISIISRIGRILNRNY